MPFNTFNKEGFKSFCKALVKYGSTHGDIDINDIIPDESSIRREYLDIAFNKCLVRVLQKTTDVTTAAFTKNLVITRF
jgi:hypothetical protein